MTTKNILKTITEISIFLMLGIAVSGLSLTPALAHADNGLGLGLEVGAHANVHQKDRDNDQDKDNGSLNIQDSMFLAGTKANLTAFKQSVKSANTTYKNAKSAAKVQLKASVSATTNPTDRTAALKAYFSNLLAAFKVKAAAIENAFQVFISSQPATTPVANTLNVSVHENSSETITLTGFDPQNLPLTYVVVSGASHGTLSGTGQNLVYTPTANFTGSDSFTFKTNNGSHDSNVATVTITVTP